VSDLVVIGKEKLTLAQFSGLADVPSEIEWLANITSPKTRRFYKNDVAEFLVFTRLKDSAAVRTVAGSYVISWRKDLEAPAPDTLNGVRKRAILDTLLYHGIRREELCLLRLRDMQSRRGSCTSVSRESATRYVLFPFTQWCSGSSKNIWRWGGTPGH
jgi:integrase